MDRTRSITAIGLLTIIGAILLAITPWSGQVVSALLGTLLLLVTPFLAGYWLRSWWTVLIMPLVMLLAGPLAVGLAFVIDLVAFWAGRAPSFPGFVQDAYDPQMGAVHLFLPFLLLIPALMAVSAALGTLSGKPGTTERRGEMAQHDVAPSVGEPGGSGVPASTRRTVRESGR